jgi:hypothetical protein
VVLHPDGQLEIRDFTRAHKPQHLHALTKHGMVNGEGHKDEKKAQVGDDHSRHQACHGLESQNTGGQLGVDLLQRGEELDA